MNSAASPAVALLASLALAGCGSDTAGSDLRDGVLIGGSGAIPAAIQGMHYQSGDQSGFTNASGTFRYHEGDSVQFSLGALQFEAVPGAPAASPYQLASGGSCRADDRLTIVLQILQSCDAHGTLDDGLQLPEVAVPAEFNLVRSIAATDLAATITATCSGAAVVPATEALDRFIRLMNDETWAEAPSDEFLLPALVSRTQGTATDGVSWYFSSANRLERTNGAFEAQADNLQPIPKDVRTAGGNHIGDVDVHGGLLYGPIEDGPDYLHAVIVTYDAATLEPTGNVYPLPHEQQTQGVPWVAVDGPRQVVYSAEWDPVDRINVYDLADPSKALRTIVLSEPLGRIQGAKVYGGVMYAARDDDEKSVWKIDLDTGIVMRLLAFGTTDSELEGIALIGSSDAAQMRVLNIVLPAVTFEKRVRTRQPLRDLVCR